MSLFPGKYQEGRLINNAHARLSEGRKGEREKERRKVQLIGWKMTHLLSDVIVVQRVNCHGDHR